MPTDIIRPTPIEDNWQHYLAYPTSQVAPNISLQYKNLTLTSVNGKLALKKRPTFPILATIGTKSADDNTRGRGLYNFKGQQTVFATNTGWGTGIGGGSSITGGSDFFDDLIGSYTEANFLTSVPAFTSATYDHTGNGEGERHLSLAGAFASYSFTAGDRLFISGGTGSVLDGFYNVASKVDDDAILLEAHAGLTADESANLDSPGSTEFLLLQNAGHCSRASGAVHGNMYASPEMSNSKIGRIEDADMPGNDGASMCRGVVQLNGRVFVCNIDGQIHNSSIDDFTTWSALDFITAERAADLGVFLCKHRDHIVYFGTESIEFFYDAGLSNGSPLQRRSDVFYSIGCVTPNAVVVDGDVVYFLGSEGKYQNTKLYKLENFQVTPIEHPALYSVLATTGTAPADADVQTSATLDNDVYLAVVPTVEDGEVLCLTVAGRITVVYNLTYRTWSWWGLANTPTNNGGLSTWVDQLPIIASVRSGQGRNALVQFLNGDICQVENINARDSEDLELTTPYETHWYPPLWDLDTNDRKRINYIRILHTPVGDSGLTDNTMELTWLDTDRAAADTFTLQSGFDAENQYPTGRTITLNQQVTANITRCGTTRQRSFKLIFNTENNLSLIHGLEIDYEILRR